MRFMDIVQYLDGPNGPVLAGKLANILADSEGHGSRALSKRLRVNQGLVRIALVRMEGLGIVYRTGRARSTTWWLG